MEIKLRILVLGNHFWLSENTLIIDFPISEIKLVYGGGVNFYSHTLMPIGAVVFGVRIHCSSLFSFEHLLFSHQFRIVGTVEAYMRLMGDGMGWGVGLCGGLLCGPYWGCAAPKRHFLSPDSLAKGVFLAKIP